MKHLAVFVVVALAACAHDPAAMPARADIEALTEAKPLPTEQILTDPTESARYNSAVEGWGEHLSAAGARICRFYVDLGAEFDCPE